MPSKKPKKRSRKLLNIIRKEQNIITEALRPISRMSPLRTYHRLRGFKGKRTYMWNPVAKYLRNKMPYEFLYLDAGDGFVKVISFHDDMNGYPLVHYIPLPNNLKSFLHGFLFQNKYKSLRDDYVPIHNKAAYVAYAVAVGKESKILKAARAKAK